MTNRLWPADAVGGAPAYSGRALRQTQSPFLVGATASRPLGARSGVRPGTSTTTVTASSTAWTCGPHAGVLDVMTAAEAGPYTYSVDSAVSGAIDASNASNPRTDLIYVQLTDAAEEGTVGQAATVTVRYLAGVAGTTAPIPATPARSVILARINVPRTGGGSPTVTWVAPYAVAAGGTLPIDTLALLNAVPGWVGGHASVTNDPTPSLNGDYRWNATTSTWQRQSLQILASRGALRGNAAPAGAGAIIQTGNDVVAVNSGGDTTLTFPATFPNGLLSFSAMSGDSSVGRFTVAVNGTGGNTAAINLHFDREGSPLGPVSARITWTAIGW